MPPGSLSRRRACARRCMTRNSEKVIPSSSNKSLQITWRYTEMRRHAPDRNFASMAVLHNIGLRELQSGGAQSARPRYFLEIVGGPDRECQQILDVPPREFQQFRIQFGANPEQPTGIVREQRQRAAVPR